MMNKLAVFGIIYGICLIIVTAVAVYLCKHGEVVDE